MPDHRLPRRVLCGQLSAQPNAPLEDRKKRSKDPLKRCNIDPPSSLEPLALDRSTWRSTCARGVQRLEDAASQRRCE
ncbi:unnamed protein product [Lampetra fluviatilis]